jgi:hypothetical protein
VEKNVGQKFRLRQAIKIPGICQYLGKCRQIYILSFKMWAESVRIVGEFCRLRRHIKCP